MILSNKLLFWSFWRKEIFSEYNIDFISVNTSLNSTLIKHSEVWTMECNLHSPLNNRVWKWIHGDCIYFPWVWKQNCNQWVNSHHDCLYGVHLKLKWVHGNLHLFSLGIRDLDMFSLRLSTHEVSWCLITHLNQWFMIDTSNIKY